jgi:S1-C subfamily serine protease
MSEAPPPELLRVTADDLARAAVPAPPPGPPPRVSQLAVASLVLSLLGAPLVGILLGPVAICCGVVALGAIQRRGTLTGLRLAIAGIVLGSLDLVGWIVGLALLVSRPTHSPSPEPPVIQSVAPDASGIAEAPLPIRRALRANVLVSCRGERGARAAGSGVIVGRGEGVYYVLTNRHVTECGGDAPALASAVTGGEPQIAGVAWRAPAEIDAVLLRVATKAPPPEPALLSAVTAPRVGDAVFAVGNPLGYEATYTAGVLSAMRAASYGDHKLRVFQVQASVNHGNSGGGLYDGAGHLIGLNTWTAAKGVAEGLGFAIATDDLFRLLQADAPPEVQSALASGGGAGGTTP